MFADISVLVSVTALQALRAILSDSVLKERPPAPFLLPRVLRSPLMRRFFAVFFFPFCDADGSCRSWFRDLEKKRCEISMDLIDAIARHVYVLLFPA
jgi:hypothetical protein